MKTLIIRAELANPPTEILAFRTLTMLSKDLNFDNLIEIEQSYKDIYYHYMKRKTLMDYVEQIITPPENEKGVRIDLNINFPYTIKLDRIIFKNIISLIGQIRFLGSF